MCMKKTELLAPAGSMSCLKAVIEAGCDAVYLGGYQFGARSFAHNFSNEEIIEAINYAHLYGVKVYVTVNTLIYENEIETCMNYIDFLHKNNVDAILVQDIGLLDLVRKTYPNLEVHSSTQMHIHNKESALFMQELGVKRVVLARETPLELIKEIKKETDIELEVFVHGALCFSYSGQCLMSSLIGGRSGNRGTCAGSCRQKYSFWKDDTCLKEGYLLSMKDLNTLDNLDSLLKAGVSSLKIEGRTKREEYAYFIVKLYRKAIDSFYEKGNIDISLEDIRIMTELFNRNFTKGFLFSSSSKDVVNTFRPNHMGVKLGTVVKSYKNKVMIKLDNTLSVQDGIRFLLKDEDYGFIVERFKVNNQFIQNAKEKDVIELLTEKEIPVGTKVVKTTNIHDLKMIQDFIKQNTRKVELTGTCILKENEKICLTLFDGKNEVTVYSNNSLQRALKQDTSKERIEEQLKKLGDTIYHFKQLTIVKEENLFVPIKELNELRRKGISLLNEKRLYKIPYKKCAYEISVPSFEKVKGVEYFIQNEEQYKMIEKKDIMHIFVQDETLYQKLKKDNRVILRLNNVLEHHKEYYQNILVGELGSIHKYKNFITDYTLNVVNSYAVAFLHHYGAKEVTLSHELTDKQIEDIVLNYQERYKRYPNLSLIVYGREVVMTSKVNLEEIYGKNGYLKDRFSNIYPIRVMDGFMDIYNYQIRDKRECNYFDMGVHYVRYDILDSKEVI